MKLVQVLGSTFLIFLFAMLTSSRDMPKECPILHGEQESKKTSPGVIERGNAAMGFDQTKTTHHFLLKKHGGIIQVTANDPADAANREMIQSHLTHITTAFSKGDFDIPMLVHGRVPPGVSEMKLLKDKIHYRFEPLEAGGRVVIETSDPKALSAVHKFLRFQIQDHGTGDSLKVN
jgi:hypothetical protein